MRRDAQLDRTFRALADGTRRSIIHRLSAGGSKSAGELGRHFRSAQPTVSRHLKVLEQARLLDRTIDGRVHRFRLRNEPLREANSWIARNQAFWEGALGQLEDLMTDTKTSDRSSDDR